MSGGGAKGGNIDLAFDKDSQAEIVKGLRAAIGELRDIASASDAETGAGFEELSMTSMEAGHNGLAKDFEDFCELWDWGVRGLIEDASKLAEKVGLAAGSQWEQEQYAQGTFKVAANSMLGNPHLDEKTVVKQDMGELISVDTWTPDYSKESFEKSAADSEKAWDAAREETSQKSTGIQHFVDQAAEESAKRGDR
ncbi:hypothetical protein [Streptomyces sp. Rer75]|uniref:hypothetical protein n=1 Tax=unclassified Streptomyces TaxID=2593676 RepID=UPI0015D09BA0|nr:hypothetical protein [Streptomyces sp. Rer75]QLH20462.1 hypothetical protein HYQ63_07255 [Streptomyces sp. Rer75]